MRIDNNCYREWKYKRKQWFCLYVEQSDDINHQVLPAQNLINSRNSQIFNSLSPTLVQGSPPRTNGKSVLIILVGRMVFI